MSDDFRKIPQQHSELTRALEKVHQKAFTDAKRKEVMKFSQAWQEYFVGVSTELFAECKTMIQRARDENERMLHLYGVICEREQEMFKHLDALETRMQARLESLREDIYGE